jgi:gluconokinase
MPVAPFWPVLPVSLEPGIGECSRNVHESWGEYESRGGQDSDRCMTSSGRTIMIMGVAGAGKTTVGRQLASELGWRFCDGDELHPFPNIDKMSRGIPLYDEDRRPWLERIRQTIAEWIATGENVILACSVLRERYRAMVLEGHRDRVQIVYLKASPALLQQRLISRTGHFMGEVLLASQLEILEEPADALVLDAADPPARLLQQIRVAFKI